MNWFRFWVQGPTAKLIALALVLLAAGALVWGQVQINEQNHRQHQQQQRDQAHNECVAKWADAFAARTTAIAASAQARNDALDTFARSLSSHNQAVELAAYKAYLRASDTYKTDLKENPLPASPRLACG